MPGERVFSQRVSGYDDGGRFCIAQIPSTASFFIYLKDTNLEYRSFEFEKKLTKKIEFKRL